MPGDLDIREQIIRIDQMLAHINRAFLTLNPSLGLANDEHDRFALGSWCWPGITTAAALMAAEGGLPQPETTAIRLCSGAGVAVACRS